MKNPLRIFTKNQLESLNDFNLRSLKKEFFKPIKFGNQTSIILNNHEVDESTLSAIFEEIESNLEEYLILIKNESLADFLENGNLSFLFNDQQYNEIKELVKNNPRIENQVADKLNYKIANVCNNLNNNSLNILESLLDFTSEFDSQNKDLCYQKSYYDIETFINKLYSDYSDPFQKTSSIKYKSEIGLHVNFLKGQIFDLLPKSFEELDYKYSKWCNECIVRKSLQRQNELLKYSKRDVGIFIEAANIAKRHFKNDQLINTIEIANKIKNTKKNSSIKGMSCLGFIVLILALTRMISGISKCSNTENFYGSSNYQEMDNRRIGEIYGSKNTRDKKNPIQTKERKTQEKKPSSKSSPSSEQKDNNKKKNKYKFVVSEEAQEKALNKLMVVEEKKDVKTDFKGKFSPIELSEQFVGENWQLLNATQKRINNRKDTLLIDFDTELLPSIDADLIELVPTSIKEDDLNITAPTIISFRNRELNIRTSHLITIPNYKNEGPKTNTYVSKQSDTNAKMMLSTKRIPYGDFNVKGQFILKETKSGKTKEKLTFTIKYDRKEKLFVVKCSNNINLNITKQDVANPSAINDKEIIAKKIATVINNLNQIHNKYLKEKNWYRIKDISEYRLIVDAKLAESAAKFGATDGNLRYNFTSIIDNLAYCELTSKNTAFKYIFDNKTGILKGMIRATTAYNKKEVEQVLIFRQ